MSNNHELTSNSANPGIESVQVIRDGQVFTMTILPPACRTRRGGLSQRGAVKTTPRTDSPSLEELRWLAERNGESQDMEDGIRTASQTGHIYPGTAHPRSSSYDTNQDHIDHIAADADDNSDQIFRNIY